MSDHSRRKEHSQGSISAKHQNIYKRAIKVRASGGMVDALASGASVRKDVEVRVLSRAPEIMTDQKEFRGMGLFLFRRILCLFQGFKSFLVAVTNPNST